MTHVRILLALVYAAIFSTPLRAADAPTAEQAAFFEAKVRPVLIENCAECHGEKKQKAGLRVDSRTALLTGGDSGPAVEPGKPDESYLLMAISHGDDAPKMPPKQKLTDERIADLTRWVQMGAPWPGDTGEAPVAARKPGFEITDADRRHWAFLPVKSPAVPQVKDRRWADNPIDAFILAKLEAKGLAPNRQATKRELIRRAYFDLIGLPPTPEDVNAFENDQAPDAYARLIDELLDSPQYGERWGRHWLDLVRYAETNSYERDNPKPHVWRYRDYVIQSFNDDKPYDRFIREQLAGDEMGGTDPLIATGYYRLGIWDDEPSDRELARYDSLDDIVATTGQVFLGLTIDCARCHDHKLDPIAQKDYYRLVSFFQNTNHFRNGGPTDEAPILADDAARLEHERRLDELAAKRLELQTAMSAITDEFRARFEQETRTGIDRPDIEDLQYRFYRDTWQKLPDFAALKFEDSGTLPLGRFDLKPRTRDDAFGFVFEGTLIVPKAGEYTFYLDSDDGSRLSVNNAVAITYDGIHGEGDEREAKVALSAGRVPIRLEYFQQGSGLGLSVAWSGPDLPRRSLSADDDGRPNPTRDLARLFRTEGSRVLGAARFKEYQTLRKKLEGLNANRNAGAGTEMALCITERGPEAPDTFVLLRGNPQTPGDKVEPAFLEVLGGTPAVIPTPPPGAKSSGRRSALADWIASPENPLTARVMANRIWQYHFGRGIVRSPSNFGKQGDAPTHPELLDWLAAEFLKNGWHLKPLHRLVMNSNAYKMSSHADSQALEADPENNLFWRFDMRRLSAEEIRDSILAVAGNLNPAMFGPSIYPKIPKEVMAGQSVPGAGWHTSPEAEQSRRSVYVHIKRSLLVPILESFDVAETDRSTPSRFVTTQPTQALGMLNGEFLHEQAAVFADRLKQEAPDSPRDQVILAWRLATSRTPEPGEIDRGLALIDALKPDLGPDGALRAFALVVLNLNEFLYLD
jgi:cytochrome c553